MNLDKRIISFVELGNQILKPCTSGARKLQETIETAYIENPWFTPEFCLCSAESIAKQWLTHSALTQWLQAYPTGRFNHNSPKTIGTIMAGNIPLVGFHDLLCVLIAGHKFLGKPSSKDGGLMHAICDLLVEIEPGFSDYIHFTSGTLKEFDAVIATGSDNSARYFDYYFAKYPTIVRKNRHSLAILDGQENANEFKDLADDIFLYFGLGCRSVAKLLVPKGYSFAPLLEQFNTYSQFINHSKYANNYQYQRAILLLNGIEHLDNGFVILTAHEGLGSPIGVIYYQYYNNLDEAEGYINSNSELIQCVVSREGLLANTIPLGAAQHPMLLSYADGIDTIGFLTEL